MFVKRRPVFDGAFVDPMDQAVRIARSEYLGFLATHGLDDVELRRKAELTSDQMPMPYGFDHVEIRPSPIEGLGMFATDDIEPWQLIAPARIDGFRTPAERYTNHACEANAFLVRVESGALEIVSICTIAAGDEVLIDYHQALCVNDGVSAWLN